MKLTAVERAHKDRVVRWVETRPRSVRLPSGRRDKHPSKGNRRNWQKETRHV